MDKLVDTDQGKCIDRQCPSCKAQIKVPAGLSLEDATFYCPHCCLEYKSNGPKDKKAQKALDDLLKRVMAMRRLTR